MSDPTALGERRLVPSNSVTVNVVRSPVVCLPKDLEPTLHFYGAPENMEVVALDYRNTSSATCLLKPVGNRPGIVEAPPIFPLNAGDTEHSSVRFRKDSWSCQNIGRLNFWLLQPGPTHSIFSPTLLPKVCLGWEPGGYPPGAFIPDWKASSSSAEEAPLPVWIAPKQTYYEREVIELRLQVKPGGVADGKCPALLETVRGGQETPTREIVNQSAINSANGCHAWSPWRGAWHGPANKYPIEVIAGGGRGLDTPGGRTVTVAELTGIGPDGEQRLVSSNAVTVNVVDGTTVPRNWGNMEQGVRVDLTLDKLSYALEDDIPLYLAFENVSAKEVVYGTAYRLSGGCSDGINVAFDFRLNVEKQDGSAPQFFERPEYGGGVFSCGMGSWPNPAPQGKTVDGGGVAFPIGDVAARARSIPNHCELEYLYKSRYCKCRWGEQCQWVWPRQRRNRWPRLCLCR